MDKLTIIKLEMLNRHWISMRFAGEAGAYRSMTTLLGMQRDYNAYWSNSVCGKDGGWIVRLAWLEQYKRRFHNFERAMDAALRECQVRVMEPIKERRRISKKYKNGK